MVFSINLDRGVHMASHPSLGMDIYMYVDDPGLYYDAHGHQVPKEWAEQAGFPVDEQTKAQEIKVALKAAEKEVLEKMGAVKQEYVAERGGFKVKDLGMGKYHVVGPDGSVLTKAPVSKEHALMALDKLAPKEGSAKK